MNEPLCEKDNNSNRKEDGDVGTAAGQPNKDTPNKNRGQEESYPTDLQNLTQAQIDIWFTIGEAAGQKILKVKPEMLITSDVEGPPMFLDKMISFEKHERKQNVLVFEKDF